MKPDEPLPEFLEAMEAIAHWMNRRLESLDRSTIHAIDRQILEDALGQSSTPVDLPRSEPDRIRLGYALLGVQSAFLRFGQVHIATRYYPWRGRIARHEHLEMMGHLFLAEVYIFEERLKKFLDACAQCERSWKTGVDVKTVRDETRSACRSRFKPHRDSRNVHTHESDVRFPEVARLGLIHLLTLGDDKFGLTEVGPTAFRSAKKRLLQDVDGVARDARNISATVLRATKPIWSRL